MITFNKFKKFLKTEETFTFHNKNMKISSVVASILLLITLSKNCMVRRIDGTSTYYCDAVTYPCSYGTCVTMPLDHGLVQCQCKASLRFE